MFLSAFWSWRTQRDGLEYPGLVSEAVKGQQVLKETTGWNIRSINYFNLQEPHRDLRAAEEHLKKGLKVKLFTSL